ncbi:VWA domain-containing protein [Candidatus Uabimicrobium sp. HlEnr_7]|uniref:VWA domain-containing protein n=1 Tax=Candidatus Uabimicrobium helgolandensis TaxID=3095367 RepID=UPI003557225C
MSNKQDRLIRWRLILGSKSNVECNSLTSDEITIDRLLEDVYNKKYTSLTNSGHLKNWLKNIRKFFPAETVRVIQKDVLERFDLKELLLLDPENLEYVEVDVNLVADLISLNSAITEETKEGVREIIKRLTGELQKKLKAKMIQSIKGAINRSNRTYRPKLKDIDWKKTIECNLKNFMPETKTIIADKFVGYTRGTSSSLHNIILCVDQSCSMTHSMIYSSIFACVLGSIKSVQTHLVLFDDSVVDVTSELDDPVDILFKAMLGGGTDINKALSYCQNLVQQPSKTILVLISDLEDAGWLSKMQEIVNSGVQVISLLALSNEGVPFYDSSNAKKLANMQIPTFSCTPELFPDLMATAINKKDVSMWAAKKEIVTCI